MKQRFQTSRLLRVMTMMAALAVALSCLSLTVFAYERIDTQAETSLTVSFTAGDTAFEGVSFRLYRVGDVSDAVELRLAGAFADAPVSLEDVESASGWADLAVTLSAYADGRGIDPDAAGTTDETGRVAFSDLTVGLYLLCGDAAVVGDHAYTPAPAMILLPTLMEDDSWNYAPEVGVKHTATFLTEYQDLSVKKVWDDGDGSARPESVTIQLLRSGAVYDTVQLSQKNNWSCTWKDLPCTYEEEDGRTGVYTYAVNEETVPEGYTVDVRQNADGFTGTNTRPAPPAPKEPTLPQTGTLNWPIPVLTIAGLILVALGWYLLGGRRKNA